MSYYQIAEMAIALGFGLCARRLVGHCRTDLEALLSDILRRLSAGRKPCDFCRAAIL